MRSARVLLGWLAALGIAGCERAKADVPVLPFASGTRLRASLLDGGAGATLFRGWYDSQLGTLCSFDRADDDRLRCLPPEAFGYEFSDAGCTQAVWVHYCGDVPTYVREPSTTVSSCDQPRLRVSQLTTNTAPVTYYKTGDGMCLLNGPVPPNATAYLVGASVGPDAFVGAESEDVNLSNGLVEQRLVGDDGTRQTVGVRDPAARDCSPTPGQGPEDVRCVPSHAAYAYENAGYYSDDACSTDIAIDFSACPAPDLVRYFDPSGCTGTVTYLSVGAEIPADQVYGTSTGICEPVTDNGLRFYQPGGLLDWSSFAELARAEIGEGRLVVPYHAGLLGELIVATGDFVDSARNERCNIYEVDGGAGLRCIPVSAHWVNGAFFANSTCAEDARLTGIYQDFCSERMPDLAYRYRNTPCDIVITSVHDVGAEHTGTIYYMPDPSLDVCMEYLPTPAEQFHVLGGPIDPMTLPAITARIE